MRASDLKWALKILEKLDPDEKFYTMLITAAIINNSRWFFFGYIYR